MFQKYTFCCFIVLSAIVANVLPAQDRELFSFQDRNPFDNGTVVENGTALRIDKGYAATFRPMDWSGYDFLKIDMDLGANSPLSLSIEIRDEKTEGYWTRVNYSTLVPPGKSVLTVPLQQLFVGEKSRPGRNLLLDKITRLVINIGDKPSGPLTLSRFRLEKDTSAQDVAFDGLFAFDFGTSDSPVMEGFTQITPETKYDKERGYGFINNPWIQRAMDAKQPEPLYQDCIIVRLGDFVLDVPDGKYRIMLNMDSPGGFWGENQIYRKRTLKINGQTVLDESQDFDAFQKKYYRFWNQDDMPSENTFDKYQKTAYDEKTFDAQAVDGKLRLGFESDGWGCCVASIIVYPIDKAEQGEKFLKYAEDKRRFHFDNYFKRTLPKPTGEPPEGNEGYVVFRRDYMQEVNVNDAPLPNEIATELHGSAFAGEYEPITLSVFPLQNLGTVSVSTDDWQGPNGNVIPASAIDIGYVSYRLSRIAMDGSIYTIAPRFIMPMNAVQMDKGTTRRFWLTVKTPTDCPSGLYKGKIVIQTEKSGSSEIAVHFLVHKGNLDAINIPVGPVGHAVRNSWTNDDPKSEAFAQKLFNGSLRKLREYGFNSATGLPRITYKGFKDGEADLDFHDSDRNMKLLKELGFTEIIAYGAGVLGFDSYYIDEKAMKSAGFDDYSEFIKAVYSAVEKHAEENDWITVYYNLADEPVDGQILPSTENAEAYQKAFPKGPPHFTGSSSFTGSDKNDPHYRLSKAFQVVNWNTHDEQSVKLMREAGVDWAFYNGGNRWTFGDYLYKCVRDYDLKFRMSWHFNACAGNPYYALDCREDDYAWCNSTPDGELIPSLEFERLREGIEDYRRLQTLQRLAKEKQSESGLRIIEDRMKSFRLGQREHDQLFPATDWNGFRAKVDAAIDALR